MTQEQSAELAIILRAQRVVDWWNSRRAPGPFATVIDQAGMLFWVDEPDAALQREAFKRVARAILEGYGHAVTDRAPLLAIVRQALNPYRPTKPHQ
jgi:hypothetical protein